MLSENVYLLLAMSKTTVQHIGIYHIQTQV